MKVEIWSDVVCPWCYIGKRRFEAALAMFAHRDEVEVVWRSFELEPSGPRLRPGSYPERLASKYGVDVHEAQAMIDRMVKLGGEHGLVLDFDKAQPGNTFDAHRLLQFALERGLQEALEERLFAATFSEGLPIGDLDSLEKQAVDVGLDAGEARAVLQGDAFSDEVRADEQRAASLGINGVPFFVIDGRYGISGAQRPDALLRVLEEAWSAAR